MRELADILAAFESLPPEEIGVLASIVHASGSTYRRIGGRLLVLPDDDIVGLISGGCLEGDLVARAGEVRTAARPRLVRYDASADADIIWGLGLGCAGIIDVLLEPVDAARPGPLAWLSAWRSQRATGVVATALAEESLGRRWALHPDGSLEGEPSEEVRAALLHARESGRSRRATIADDEVTLEVVPPPQRLVVFGAGPDAVPVVALAASLGWDVDVLDHRPAYALPERFPGARVHLRPAEEAVAAAEIDRAAHVILMTHHYLVDRTLLADVLTSQASYIGLLGPKQRAEDLLADIEAAGSRVSPEARRRLHAPAGLDVGGEGPEAIALSLVAEVLAVAEGRSGGWLRDRKGPIHEPEPA